MLKESPESALLDKRRRLAELISAQTPTPCDAETAAMERLRNPDSLVLITGQQCGLMLGPALVLYKTLDLLRVSRSLSSPTVCVFWMEGNDHDWAEAARLHLPGRRIVYEQSTESAGCSVGHLPLSEETRADAVSQFENSLGAYPCVELGQIRDTLLQAKDLADQFRHYMRRIFAHHGLLLLDPSDPDARELAVPFWTALADNANQLKEALVSQTEVLRSQGQRIQVEIDSRADFFVEDQWGKRVRPEVAKLPKDVRRVTPTVLTRPLLQDWLCDTWLTVLGPGEMSYQLQLDLAYEALGLCRPHRMPRTHIQLQLREDRDTLLRYGIPVEEPPRPGSPWPEHLLAQFPGARKGIADRDQLEHLASELEDLTERRSTEYRRPDLLTQSEKVSRQIRQLGDRLLQAGQQIHKVELRSLQERCAWLDHKDHPQERQINALALLCRMGGIKVVDLLLEGLPPVDLTHLTTPLAARVTLDLDPLRITDLE